MGNQGTTNWKFIAFFAVSLMLIAGLFTDAAIARDGSGTASVTWMPTANAGRDTVQDTVFRGNNVLYEHNSAVNTGATADTAAFRAPMPAGSSENQLMFSYRVTTNMAGGEVQFTLPSGWAITTKVETIEDVAADPFSRYGDDILVLVSEKYDADAGETGDADASFTINRAGKKEVGADGTGAEVPETLPSSPSRDQRLAHRVTVDGTSVTIGLSNDWRSGGEVVVVLRNVTAAVPKSLEVRPEDGTAPYHKDTIIVKSKKSGNLDLLDPVDIDADGDTLEDDTVTAPFVRVGNILGRRIDTLLDADDNPDSIGLQYYGPDTIARDFTITPEVVYEGETDETFRVTFSANGPMYGILNEDPDDADEIIVEHPTVITITIPNEIQDRITTSSTPPGDPVLLTAANVKVVARGRVLPSGNLSVSATEGDEVVIDDADGTVTINLDRIDDGATITLTYNLRGRDIDEDDEADTDSLIIVPANNDSDVSAFTIMTTVPTNAGDAGTPLAPTLITGGRIHPEQGSGTMEITVPSDSQVEADENVSAITLVYTSATTLDNVDLTVNVSGIVLVDDPTTEELDEMLGSSDDYGEISFKPDTFSPGANIIGPVVGSGEAASVLLTFNGLTFERAGQTFTITIKNVRVRETGGNVEFTTSIGPTDSLEPLEKSPTLYITDTQDGTVEFKINDTVFQTYSAGQELDSITFSFKAVSTSIKDGQVRFTLPEGWTPPKKPSDDGKLTEVGELSISGGGFVLKADAAKGLKKTPISVSGQMVTVGVPMLPKDDGDPDTKADDPVTIKINKFQHATTKVTSSVKVQGKATEAGEPEKITGFFWTSGSRGRGYDAGKVEVEITNAADDSGTATISPSELKAGSNTEEITIKYTAVGTMDGGDVRLRIPNNWGNLQDEDATEANFVTVKVIGGGTAEANVADRAVIARLTGVEKDSVVQFSYGGGTVSSRNGAEVEPNIRTVKNPAEFIIETDGDGDGSFARVKGMQRTKAVKDAETKAETKPLGTVYDSYPGSLFVEVKGADDGAGTAEVEIVSTEQGEGMYPDDQDSDGDGNRTEVLDDLMRIHAGDMGTYLKFTYTPTQTIQSGQLKFKTLGDWSAPFNSPGTPGYTYFDEMGSADIGNIEFDDSTDSVTVDINSIDSSGQIEIHYGAYEGDDDGSGAVAPTATSTSSPFSISVKGGDATTNQLKPIRTAKNAPIAVRVYSQASGGGNVSASTSDNKGDVGAGSADREVTVVYTAAGEISGGSLKLTVPAKWSYPTMDNVEISTTGAINRSSALYGGAYVGDPDVTTDDTFPEDADEMALLTAVDVTVGGVNLDAEDTVTFVYSAAMVQPGAGDAKFAVAVDGGSGPGDAVEAVIPDPADATTIVVGDAAPGSGSGSVEIAQAVTINSTGNTLTFIYTPSGQITDRTLDIRVQVPTGWSVPTDRVDAEARGSFTVTHKKFTEATGTLALQTAAAAAVEKLGPFDRQMAARLKSSGSLAAGDQVVFNFENVDAPATVGASTFTMFYGAVQVTDADLTVIVGSGKDAAMLMVTAPATLLVEAEDPAMITVELQDEDGNEVPAAADMDVMLESDSPTGSFMVDGVEEDVVTIMQGSSSAMADYTDSTVGAATITASSGTLTAGTATVTVTTDVVEITSATVTSLAKAGGTVTVVAMGTTGKAATFSVGSIVTSRTMMEDETGSYSGSFPVVADQHADGDYDVTVNLNGESMTLTGALTLDSTAPTVTVSDIEGMVANGDTVMISAMVDDGTGSGVASVMADVSMLDSTQTDMVALTMANGAYSAAITISEDNAAMNGEQTITVTAMDAAGNSSAPATVMVTLLNTLSFTSTLPAGISLFHVPLDVEGLDTVGDLETMLGNNVNLLITYDGTTWNSRSDDVMITATLGILVSLSAETMVTFEGNAWADSSVTLAAGSNLIGLPVNDPNVTMISDIMGLFSAGTVSSIIVASGGEFQLVAAAGDAADGPVAGDAAYLVVATAAGSAMLSGDGWMNGEMAGAAPIALAGYTVDNQTPVLDLLGSVVDEITGLAKEGFRVKVKNLSTKAALSNIIAVEASEGYNMTFVDLADSYAARVGDVLEITADSPDPLIGIKPVRHIVTVDDVKSTRIQLEDLIAYEIPAETELLRNYPNPFNPETWIPYRLAEDANVSLTIYDTSGALVRSIDIGHQTAAVYETRAKALYWDGRNQFGEQVASGIYFYSLIAGDFSATRKMVILK